MMDAVGTTATADATEVATTDASASQSAGAGSSTDPLPVIAEQREVSIHIPSATLRAE